MCRFCGKDNQSCDCRIDYRFINGFLIPIKVPVKPRETEPEITEKAK